MNKEMKQGMKGKGKEKQKKTWNIEKRTTKKGPFTHR
jgi:hypothetical protein